MNCNWSDVELASIPCAYGTSENMLTRANVNSKDHILITGASGGVGSALIQLAKRRGCQVSAICGKDKLDQVKSVGADHVLHRDDDRKEKLKDKGINVVIDNVGGDSFKDNLSILSRGGRYVTSGAIAGPIVELDLRELYLNDITLIGTTGWEEEVFPNLVSYIEKNEIRPLVYKEYPLEDIVKAHKEFLKKKHVGKIVLKIH